VADPDACSKGWTGVRQAAGAKIEVRGDLFAVIDAVCGVAGSSGCVDRGCARDVVQALVELIRTVVDDDVLVEARRDQVRLTRDGAGAAHRLSVEDQSAAGLEAREVDGGLPIRRELITGLVGVELSKRRLTGCGAGRGERGAATVLLAVDLRTARHGKPSRTDHAVGSAGGAVVRVTQRGAVLDHHVAVRLHGGEICRRG